MNARLDWRPRLRRVTDRIVQPYVARFDDQINTLRAEIANGRAVTPAPDTAVAVGAMSDRFHMINHELRTLELERLHGEYERVLSVGAQGSWYFEWFRSSVGDVSEHIGVEAYEPKPDDLPPYVTWVTDTADRMVNVASGTVDLVFAGQTSEHLWAHELVGFLTEAHRVLRDGGRLVLDSPNRDVTEHLHWSHGGHTIELDAHEMSALLDLAGFEVEEIAGVWCCRLDGRVLQLEEGLDDPVTLTRRMMLGREHPDDCFVWWINARRQAREPQTEALAARVAELFAAHWSVRVSRGFFRGALGPLDIARGRHEAIASTLPFPLHAGDWTVTVRLTSGSWDAVSELTVGIDAPGGHRVHELRLAEAQRDGEAISWRINQPHLLFALVLTLTIDTDQDLVIAAPIELNPVAADV